MKIRAIPSRCDAHGMCFIVDDVLFPLDDDGYIAITEDVEVPESQEELARKGVDACPVGAIELIDDREEN